ncbi:MAG: hypothetical protein LBM95_08340 [Lactobacillales bacterium]|nr:hypothetical protein [Lactobacillales bacterium]
MKKLYITLILGVLLILFTACMKPENLIEDDTKSDDGKVIETFSNEVIKLLDLDVQLKEIEQLNAGDNSAISLTFVLVNQLSKKEMEIDNNIFSISATQNNQTLTVLNPSEPFTLSKEKELTYQFILNSETDTVLFTFNYNNGDRKRTKHYNVYLE